MAKLELELDPREAEQFIRPLPARQQLVYRLAVVCACPSSPTRGEAFVVID